MIRNTDGFQIVDVSINPQDEDTKYLVVMPKQKSKRIILSSSL